MRVRDTALITRGSLAKLRANMYDDLGNFVLDGVGVFELEEGRTNPPESGSFIDKSRFYQQLPQSPARGPRQLRQLEQSADHRRPHPHQVHRPHPST